MMTDAGAVGVTSVAVGTDRKLTVLDSPLAAVGSRGWKGGKCRKCSPFLVGRLVGPCVSVGLW
jgi:hypothetical protein